MPGSGASSPAFASKLSGAIQRQALEDGRVFRIDRQQGRPALAHRVHEEGTAHHQGLLVGQHQALAGAGGSQAGRQAGCADDGGHDQRPVTPPFGGRRKGGPFRRKGDARPALVRRAHGGAIRADCFQAYLAPACRTEYGPVLTDPT